MKSLISDDIEIGLPSPVLHFALEVHAINLVDVREHLQEIPIAQVVGLLRAICSRYHDRERLPVIAESTRGYIQFSCAPAASSRRTSTGISWPGLALAMLKQFALCGRSRTHVGDSNLAM